MDFLKDILRPLFSQVFLNNFYHLPKAILANLVYGFPTRNLKVIGVTGTDGKSTTTNMLYHILKDAGKKVSMVSTVNAMVGGKTYETGFHVTSPDPFLVQKFAKDAVENKDEYLILEVTSHGLDQYRFWGIKFNIAVITNITHEHLDYHKSYQNYKNTKLSILKEVKYAIVNQDLKDETKKNCSGKIITFGLKGDFNQKEVKLNLDIPGEYNIENALAAMGVAFVLGVDRKLAQKTLENFKGIAGRMEFVKNNKGIKIVVDFAHTPNALKQALITLRTGVKQGGRLIAVFGSAGRRDIKKRSLMGETAGKMADISVVTPEDPRGELEVINKQIAVGLKKTGAKEGVNFFIINDRAQAINFAIKSLAKKYDTVGIFGKGHEKSMNMDGKIEIPWSDQESVEKALNN